MAQQRTPVQLERGARAIAYRTQQLSYGVILLLDWPLPGLRVGVDNVLKNALVESGLANARALAHFFGDKKSDVHFTAYAPKWSDDVTKIASEIDGPISRYLGHASYGGKKGEPHPGQWPLPEMAVILVGAGARFVDSLGSEAGWFIRLRLRRSVGWPVSSAMISKSLPTELSKQRSTVHCGVGPRPVGQFPRCRVLAHRALAGDSRLDGTGITPRPARRRHPARRGPLGSRPGRWGSSPRRAPVVAS